MKDNRIKEYQYLNQLKDYIEKAEKQYIPGIEGSFIYPKQLEIHLPSDRVTPCNLSCNHCFSTTYKKSLGRWENYGLHLLHNLQGEIPYSIFGGAYTEPTASPFLFTYLDVVKQYDNHFGLHTNGTYLLELEKQQRFLTNVHEISTDKEDYISISLDAGSGLSWQKLKHKDKSNFWNIIQAIEIMSNIREKLTKNSHAIRLVYLVSDETCGQDQFDFVVDIAKLYNLDSVRFSIPYDYYNTSFYQVRQYKEFKEIRLADIVERYTKDLISNSKNEKPYVFYNPPYSTDIERFNFDECFYGLFQITLAADGFVYPCSAVAAPTAKHLRIGEISSNLEIFNAQCWEIQNNNVKCRPMCFEKGLRCNRMGLEINEYYNGL